ncbi:MAG: arsenate reductase (glutaredoxin) [Chromatiaceae bacterium]|nr:arsenate reductase (glutaredoxin) [Chromatiaceae bacterium]MCP5438835.1 arsenate reductase (glutaredoxin) [Chromatiaceae bacterium]HPE79608.1 arsenate reductase (glutaredoxin) [Gammaproteobacteria bacterium]
MSISIYHNPRCSKSRQTLQLLEQQQLTPQVIQYLDTPPDAATLSRLLDMLGLTPRELMRKGEPEYKASGADDPSLSREQLIALMVRFPKLIERPIVVSGDKAVIGRPPERVLEIL